MSSGCFELRHLSNVTVWELSTHRLLQYIFIWIKCLVYLRNYSCFCGVTQTTNTGDPDCQHNGASGSVPSEILRHLSFTEKLMFLNKSTINGYRGEYSVFLHRTSLFEQVQGILQVFQKSDPDYQQVVYELILMKWALSHCVGSGTAGQNAWPLQKIIYDRLSEDFNVTLMVSVRHWLWVAATGKPSRSCCESDSHSLYQSIHSIIISCLRRMEKDNWSASRE